MANAQDGDNSHMESLFDFDLAAGGYGNKTTSPEASMDYASEAPPITDEDRLHRFNSNIDTTRSSTDIDMSQQFDVPNPALPSSLSRPPSDSATMLQGLVSTPEQLDWLNAFGVEGGQTSRFPYHSVGGPASSAARRRPLHNNGGYDATVQAQSLQQQNYDLSLAEGTASENIASFSHSPVEAETTTQQQLDLLQYDPQTKSMKRAAKKPKQKVTKKQATDQLQPVSSNNP